jgi:hypothetical protein
MVRENRVNCGRKDVHCPKSLTSFVTENGSGSSCNLSYSYVNESWGQVTVARAQALAQMVQPPDCRSEPNSIYNYDALASMYDYPSPVHVFDLQVHRQRTGHRIRTRQLRSTLQRIDDGPLHDTRSTRREAHRSADA